MSFQHRFPPCHTHTHTHTSSEETSVVAHPDQETRNPEFIASKTTTVNTKDIITYCSV